MDIFEQLRRDEGFGAKPYRDSAGKTTIGFGRNLDDVGISEAEANYLLENDVGNAIGRLRHNLPWVDSLDEARFGVLVNMCFNLGIQGLLQFRDMLGKTQQGLYDEAAAAMQDSVWYHQLPIRAKRLVTQMQKGEWQ